MNLNYIIRSMLVNSNEVIWFACITRSGDIEGIGNFPTELSLITDKAEYLASYHGQNWWLYKIKESYSKGEYEYEYTWQEKSCPSEEVNYNLEYLFWQWAIATQFTQTNKSTFVKGKTIYCDRFYHAYDRIVKQPFLIEMPLPIVESAVFNSILNWGENDLPVYAIERIPYRPPYYGEWKRIFPVLMGQPDNKGLKYLYKRFSHFYPDNNSFIRIAKYGSDGSQTYLKAKHLTRL